MVIVGLTGNIGSGKSTVLHRLARLGAEVIDADHVSRDVVAPGSPGLEKIVKGFGPGVIDENGELDRAKMAAIVFEDPEARVMLEAIVHPEVIRVVGRLISEYREGRGRAPVLVVEAPLLIESGMHGMMDEVWLVTVSPETQVRRVVARSGISGEEVMQRIKVQMPQEEKRKYAHRVIDNSGSIDETIMQIDAIWARLMGREPS